MARDFWAADCETDPFKHGRFPEPFIFGAYNPKSEQYEEFATAREFVEFFRDKDVVIYAHNGGKFDWHFILPFLEEQTEILIIAGRLAKFKIGKAEYRDSFNLFPIPLAAYKKDEIDYALFEKGIREKHMDKIRAYLRADCVYLSELLTRFFKDYGRQITLASAAMAQWRKISNSGTVQTSQDFYKTIAPFYYGGRVECFKSGVIKKRFHVYDIKSAYPRAMIEQHPWGDCFTDSHILPNNDDEISRCFITVDCAATGCFPYKKNGSLEFPNDHAIRRFEITGWEYLAARDTGMIGNARIVRVIRFHQSIDFKDYVDKFFADKQRAENEKDSAGRTFAKLMLNSLYGKWSSAPHEYQEYLTVHPAEKKAHQELYGYTPVEDLHNVALMSRPLPEDKLHYYNVAVGASITGWVRAYLWRAVCTVKEPLYCDTDSIACVDGSALSLGPELGQWEDEGEFKEAAIAGKKLYAFEYVKPFIKDGKKITHKTASKGVRLLSSQIKAVAMGETIEYKNEAPTFGIRGKTFVSRKVKKTTKGWPNEN